VACYPTNEQRNVVERAAGFGLPQVYICQLIVSERTGKPISLETLESAFRAELDRGMALAHYQVAKSLYEQAVGGNVTAAIWWTKARMGWSETVIQQKESDESSYDRMSTEENRERIGAARQSAGREDRFEHRMIRRGFPGLPCHCASRRLTFGWLKERPRQP
jgi:hypothetical protein